jgi:malate dehydrogenase
VKALTTPTAESDCFSVGVCSDGSYGIEKGLIYSFPIRSDGITYQIIQDVPVNDFGQSKITETETELKEEKSMVADLL